MLHLRVALHAEHNRDEQSHVDHCQLRLDYVLCLLVPAHVGHELVLLLLEPRAHVLQGLLHALHETLRRVEYHLVAHFLDFEGVAEEQHHCGADSVVEFLLGVVVEGDGLVHLLDDDVVLQVDEQPADSGNQFRKLAHNGYILGELHDAAELGQGGAEGRAVDAAAFADHAAVHEHVAGEVAVEDPVELLAVLPDLPVAALVQLLQLLPQVAALGQVLQLLPHLPGLPLYRRHVHPHVGDHLFLLLQLFVLLLQP